MAKAQLMMPGAVGYKDALIGSMAKEKLIFVGPDAFQGDLYIQVSDQDAPRTHWVNVGRIQSGQRLTKLEVLGKAMRIRPGSKFNAAAPPTVWITSENAIIEHVILDVPANPPHNVAQTEGDAEVVSHLGGTKTIKCAEADADQNKFRGTVFVDGIVGGVAETIAVFHSQGQVTVKGVYDQLQVRRKRPPGGAAVSINPVVSVSATREIFDVGGNVVASGLTLRRFIDRSAGSYSPVKVILPTTYPQSTMRETDTVPVPWSLQSIVMMERSSPGNINDDLAFLGLETPLVLNDTLLWPGDNKNAADNSYASARGIWEVTVVGDGSTPWQLTRVPELDSYSDVRRGATVTSIGGGQEFILSYTGDQEDWDNGSTGFRFFPASEEAAMDMDSLNVYELAAQLIETYKVKAQNGIRLGSDDTWIAVGTGDPTNGSGPTANPARAQHGISLMDTGSLWINKDNGKIWRSVVDHEEFTYTWTDLTA